MSNTVYLEQIRKIASNIIIDNSRNNLLDEISAKRLSDSYMMSNESNPQERYALVSSAFCSSLEHAQRMYDYSSKHWFGYSTPILSFGRNKRGLPISCFLPMVPDTSAGLVDTLSEVNWMSMLGGGVGLYFAIRSKDDKSAGTIPHMKTYDASSLAYKQGTTRRGSYAVYMDIDHPEIVEFLEMRKVSGDPNRRCLNLHNGVNISDAFMQKIENCMKDLKSDDSWELKDPVTGKVKEVVSAKDLWIKILELRSGAGRGEPYIHFVDTSNRLAPEAYKKHNLEILHSNLCSEITLSSDVNHSAICALSSINLVYWDEYKDNEQFFIDIAEFMDNVLNYFIDFAPDTIKRAKNHAYRERSIGLGCMGFHTYLQQKDIPFEGPMAKSINNSIFSHYKKMLNKANKILGSERGSPPLLEGTGLRFTHMIALAPTASNALICGNVSPSVEPLRANAFRQDTLSGSFIQKNKTLDNFIKKYANEHGLDTSWVSEQWVEIVNDAGSVKNLKWMDDYHKDVYKTAAEIDNYWIIEHASDRQKSIDQGQSINLFIEPTISIPRLHSIHYAAWKKGLKTLYYCRSEKLYNAEVSKKVERKKLEDDIQIMKDIASGEECLACEG